MRLESTITPLLEATGLVLVVAGVAVAVAPISLGLALVSSGALLFGGSTGLSWLSARSRGGEQA